MTLGDMQQGMVASWCDASCDTAVMGKDGGAQTCSVNSGVGLITYNTMSLSECTTLLVDASKQAERLPHVMHGPYV